jgi:hypothetical protein
MEKKFARIDAQSVTFGRLLISLLTILRRRRKSQRLLLLMLLLLILLLFQLVSLEVTGGVAATNVPNAASIAAVAAINSLIEN